MAAPGLYLVYLVRLLYLALAAGLIWVLGKLERFPLTYGQSYKIGLYAMTGALLIELLIVLGQPWLRFEGFPFMFTLITCALVAINLYGARQAPISSKPDGGLRA